MTLEGYQAVISNGYHTGVTRSAWVATTAYVAYVKGTSAASVVIPTTANGYQYRCVTAGTSHSSEPTWPTSLGETVTETGGVVWEMDGRSGDEYSLTAPLKVRSQELLNSNGVLACQLDLFGLPDQLAKQEALTSYTQESDDTNTVKDLIADIASATLSCYSHLSAITVVWDSEDSLIDTFYPADYFHISVGESRLAKIKELLGWTKCVMRFEDDGKLHISSPTISGNAWVAATAYVLRDYVQPTTPTNLFAYRCTTAGTSHATTEPTWPTTAGGTVTESGSTLVWTAVAFDYEYNDDYASTSHPFFSKTYRTRLVIPNEYVIKNADDPADVATYYDGSATSATSYALLPITKGKILRISSDAQGDSVAKALIQRAELDHEKGSLFAPTNVGAEVHDYVKVTDNVENDNRIGNIGYLTRYYDAGKFNFFFGFGDILLAAGIGLGGTTDQPYVTYADFLNWYNVLDTNTSNAVTLIGALTTIIEQMQDNYTFRKLIVTEELHIPNWS